MGANFFFSFCRISFGLAPRLNIYFLLWSISGRTDPEPARRSRQPEPDFETHSGYRQLEHLGVKPPGLTDQLLGKWSVNKRLFKSLHQQQKQQQNLQVIDFAFYYQNWRHELMQIQQEDACEQRVNNSLEVFLMTWDFLNSKQQVGLTVLPHQGQG